MRGNHCNVTVGAVHQSALRRLTCAEQQQDLHAQVLVVGDLQANKLVGDLQHELALVRHVGQLHPLPGRDDSQQGDYMMSFDRKIMRFTSETRLASTAIMNKAKKQNNGLSNSHAIVFLATFWEKRSASLRF